MPLHDPLLIFRLHLFVRWPRLSLRLFWLGFVGRGGGSLGRLFAMDAATPAVAGRRVVAVALFGGDRVTGGGIGVVLVVSILFLWGGRHVLNGSRPAAAGQAGACRGGDGAGRARSSGW